MLNQGNFAGKKFTKVQATWTVPAFGNPPNGETHCAAIFVGLDGGSELLSKNLFQAGVAQIVSTDAAGRTTQDCHAWYLWDPTGGLWDPNYLNNKVPGFPVSPGDEVTVILEYKQASNQGSAQFSITNGQALAPILFNVDQRFVGDTMQWIMERPSNPNSANHRPRRKLGKVNVKLTNAFGFTSDSTRVAPKDGDALNMEPDDSTDPHPKPPLAVATVGYNPVDHEFVDIKFRAHGP